MSRSSAQRAILVGLIALLLVGALLALAPWDSEPTKPAYVPLAQPATSPSSASSRVNADLTPTGPEPERVDTAEEPAPALPAPSTDVAATRSEGIATPYGRVVRVRGVVVDAAGVPRAGASVELTGGQRNRPEGRLRSPHAPGDVSVGGLVAELLAREGFHSFAERLGLVRSAVDGSFEVELAPQALTQLDSLCVVAEDPLDGSLAPARLDPVPLSQDGVCDLGRLVLRPTLRLELLVRSGGRPLEGATVELEGRMPYKGQGDWPHEAFVRHRATTDARGELALVLLGERFQVELSHPGHASAARKIGATRGVERLVFDLAPGQELRGVVRGMAGRAVARAYVVAEPADRAFPLEATRADEEGRFTLQGLGEAVQYEVSALDVQGKHARASAKVTTPAAFLELLRIGGHEALLRSLVAVAQALARALPVGDRHQAQYDVLALRAVEAWITSPDRRRRREVIKARRKCGLSEARPTDAAPLIRFQRVMFRIEEALLAGSEADQVTHGKEGLGMVWDLETRCALPAGSVMAALQAEVAPWAFGLGNPLPARRDALI